MGNRRKALLLVSNGYDFDPFPAGPHRHRSGLRRPLRHRHGSTPSAAIGSWRSSSSTTSSPTATWPSELAAVTGAANRVNAAIYTLDPRGVVGTTNVEPNVDITELRTHIGKTQSSLQVLAEATGGFAVVNDNDVRRRAEAHRRRDQRLLHPGLLLRPTRIANAPEPTGRGEDARGPGVQVASRGWYRTRDSQRPRRPSPDRRSACQRVQRRRSPHAAALAASRRQLVGALLAWSLAHRAGPRAGDRRSPAPAVGPPARSRHSSRASPRSTASSTKTPTRPSCAPSRPIRASRWPTGARR